MVWGYQNQGLAHTRQVNYTDWHWKPSFYLHLNCRTSFVPGLGHSVYFINITQYAYGMYPFCGWDSSVHFLDGTEFHWIDILLIFFFFLLLKGIWIVSSLEMLQITCLWTFWYMPHMPSIRLLMSHPRSPECALISLRRHCETAEKHCYSPLLPTTQKVPYVLPAWRRGLHPCFYHQVVCGSAANLIPLPYELSALSYVLSVVEEPV